ncbi:ribosomal protein L7/L12 [Streptomyces natalensis]|uniref:Large ribosomal subunit protein bL12 C-terminal domain-containing protein n=1 Tax=Streptomyces natalensis ATCC 27448 TaxID=1240678 RepID=A0A0D7CRR9_9ACTN|nr:ribosomal protein L7/L12 [Streptomyces natalensis]KIZ18726.1 hypothetical protein SNA_05480 [Streptomyces natalensis ATCC 27448]
METLIPGIVLVVLSIATVVSNTDRRAKVAERRLRMLDRKIDLMLEHLGVEDSTAELAFKEIDELLAQDKKIHAIKAYRDLTGAGLAEAKEAIDGRMR